MAVVQPEIPGGGGGTANTHTQWHVGDKVSCSADYTYDGKTRLASFVKTTTYSIISINGDRVVIGINGVVTAAVNANTLKLISCASGGTTGSTPIPASSINDDVKPQNTSTEKTEGYSESAMSSKGIEDVMTAFLTANNSGEILKYNMRLFGVPHQFSQYCDYRTYSISNSQSGEAIGRKFIEHIFLEAPVITIIPGKPLYLPAAKNKKGVSYGLMTAANGNIATLFTALDEENLNEKLRYYDFQADYFKYMEYVNILCTAAAAFLDLQDYKIPGQNLGFTKYKWQNYRWNVAGYESAAKAAMQNIGDVALGMVDALKTLGSNIISTFSDFVTGNGADKTIDALTAGMEEDGYLEALEAILTTCNFVQFYVDPKSGYSESGDNQTSQSKIQGALDSGQELMKEVAFLANSAGLGAEADSLMEGASDALSSLLSSGGNGAISGVLSRIGSVTSNVIKGDNMIFPEIYQSSGFSKSYTINIDLRTPYGNRLSYYLNILVPLFHLLCLVLPKQSTANTYKSPFLVKCFMPGTFSCNLGMVSSIQIDKNPDGDAWSVDGFPTHVKVSLSIKDLYSDLSITPTGDVTLFLANSSLIEYIGTNCGINLVTPQLKNRIKLISSVVDSNVFNIPGNIENIVFGGLESLITSMTGV